MDEDGFREYLVKREVPEEKIVESITLIERFESVIDSDDTLNGLDSASLNEVTKFVSILIEEKTNTYDNLAALARYGYCMNNMDLYLAVLELFDGAEVPKVLHEKLGDAVGENKRNDVFEGIDLPPLGTPSSEKPKFTKAIMDKMEAVVDPETCQKVLSDVAHGLPDDYWKAEREKYLEAGNIDDYLAAKRKAAIENLEKHRDDGSLFYNQEINDEVVEWVKSRPDVLTGERQGNAIYHTKIPFLAKKYLEETDDRMKRYYACHCAWARETILDGDMKVSPTFCYCSGGFTKKPWEAALDQTLKVEMVKSALKGDDECAFKIYLPEGVK